MTHLVPDVIARDVVVIRGRTAPVDIELTLDDAILLRMKLNEAIRAMQQPPALRRYEVLCNNGAWLPCKSARPQHDGSLYYQLTDNCNGFCTRNFWRLV